MKHPSSSPPPTFRKLRIEEEDEVGTETMDFNPPRFRLEAGAAINYF